MPPLPNCDEGHKVPSGFWKIIAVKDAGVLRVAAFTMDQELSRTAKVIDQLDSVDELEQRSGLDFFWELPVEQQGALESAMHADWVNTWLE